MRAAHQTGNTLEVSSGREALELSTMRQVTWRILPYLMICYLVSYIDRVNIGFAALQMRSEMDLGNDVFGTGASLFLVTYCIFSVPANLALQKFGARRWIGTMMVVWGAVSIGMVMIDGRWSFYAFRLLLGAAEAGFLPGVIFYISRWFPKAYRGQVSALFLVAIPASSAIGSPISASLLQLHGGLGLSGWQWMFLLEGLPAVLLGVGFVLFMNNEPEDARWLSRDSRQWLQHSLEAERSQIAELSGAKKASVWTALCNPAVIALSLIYAGVISVGICLSLWQPIIIKSYGLTDFQTGLINSVPFCIATVAMIWWGRSSDRHNDRTWHTFWPLALSGAALLAAMVFHSLPAVVVILTLALIGTYAAKGPFWAMVTQWCPENISAVGIAVVSAVGSIAAALSTYLLGEIQKATGSFSLALLPLIALAVVASVVLLVAGLRRRALEKV
ncbi:MFS family permease [Rhizobium sp. BK313]|uniref:MFS transporter n=1 Tax=Rhizobium sp. BK313 TaxID=2587081 RepID=UPI00182A1C07|nr:MFS transporter [Rhizobium sp. BK313]MBB3458118.1 MFS family permease [Rhizobium sp. BK313]